MLKYQIILFVVMLLARESTSLTCTAGQQIDIVEANGDNGSCDCDLYCARNWGNSVRSHRTHWTGATSYGGGLTNCKCVQTVGPWCHNDGSGSDCQNPDPNSHCTPKAPSNYCINCPTGYFQSQTAGTPCKQCSESISSCSAGKYYSVLNRNDLTSCCMMCDAGKYNAEIGATSATSCKLCQAATYSNETGATSVLSCKSCQAGTYSMETGQTSSINCKACQIGTYSTKVRQTSSASCKPCQAGTYSNEPGADNCKGQCAAGRYSTKTEQTSSASCKPCQAGTYSTEPGADHCNGICNIGTYSSEIGQTINTCQECPTHKYSSKTGSSNCLDCPAGWETTSKGSTACYNTKDQINIVFIVGASVCAALVVGVFAICLFSQKKKEHDVELGELYEQDEINQRLLESATNPLEQDQFTILPEDLNLGPRIGAGGCGLIYKATLGANTVVAAKEIITAMMNPKDLKEFIHEARMLTQMNHPHCYVC